MIKQMKFIETISCGKKEASNASEISEPTSDALVVKSLGMRCNIKRIAHSRVSIVWCYVILRNGSCFSLLFSGIYI